MKVTKKILARLLAASMVVSSATVWAAGSRTNNVTLPEESAGKYVVADDIKETPSYKALAEKAPEVVSLIDEVNAGTADAASFVETMKEVLADEECFTLKQLEINGNDLMNIGVKDGKLIGKILKTLLSLVIEDKIENNRAKLLEKAKTLSEEGQI